MRAFATYVAGALKGNGEPNPFARVQMLNTEDDIRRKRRAATVDEVDRLVQAAVVGPVVARLPGRDRAMLYRVALGLCLRAKECASLTPESFR